MFYDLRDSQMYKRITSSTGSVQNLAVSLLSLLVILFSSLHLTAQLNVSFSVQQPPCFGLPSGSITATATGGVAPYIFQWSNGQSGATISGLVAGSYSVTVTSSNGLSTIRSATVTQPPLIVANIDAGGACTAPFNLTAVTSGGVPPYNYHWTGGSTAQTLPNVAPGYYCVTVTDQNNCGALECINVGANAVNLTVLAVPVSCFGGNNGSLTATASGGQPPFSYVWSNGQIGNAISNLSPGQYTVTVTDAAECVAVATTTITQPAAAVNVTFNTSQPACQGSTSGTINSVVTGGTAPYSYLWNTGATTPSLNNLPAGTYSLTVTDTRGCQRTASTVLTNQSTLAVSAVATQPLCGVASTGSITANVSGGSQPITFAWSNGATTQTITSLPAGVYAVTVTDGVGCVRTASATISNPAAAINLNISAVQISCFGGANGSLTATASGGQPPYSYAWSNGQTVSTINNLTVGQYSVTVTDAAECEAVAFATITQPSAAVNVALNVIQPICLGSANGTVNSNVTGGTPPYTYLWSTGATTPAINNLPAGAYTVTVTDTRGCLRTATTVLSNQSTLVVNAVATQPACGVTGTGSITASINGGLPPITYAWSNGATTPTITNLVAGAYTVTVVDGVGCQRIASATIINPVALQIQLSSTNMTSCAANNGTASVLVTAGQGPFAYAWSNGAGTASINNLSQGTYSVTVVSQQGCTATGSVTITRPPDVLASISGSTAACQNNSTASLTANASAGTPPYFYNWSNGATTATIVNLPAGDYLLTVTDALGCTAFAQRTIAAAPAVDVTITGTTVICGLGSTGVLIAAASGGLPPYTYSWSNGDTTQAIDSLTSGTYTVTVTDANSCQTTGESSIVQVADFMISVATVDVGCFGESTGSAVVTATGGATPYEYLWANIGNTPNVSGLSAATYFLTVTESTGCSLSTTVVIEQPPLLTVTITADQQLACFGDSSVVLTANAAGGIPPYSYLWSNGQTTQSITVSAQGAYSVTVTDMNECTAVATYTVQLNPEIFILTQTNTIVCGNLDGAASVLVTGGSPPYQYQWSTGDQTPYIQNVSGGTYDVTITDSQGCTEVSSLTIGQLTDFTVNIIPRSVRCFGGNTGSIETTVTGGTLPYSYTWSTGATNVSMINNLTAGSYGLTVTDAAGCIFTGSIIITQPLMLNLATSSNPVSCFGGNNGTATAVASGGVNPYFYAWSNNMFGQTINNLTVGSYTVTVTDGNLCQTTATVSVTQPANITTTVTAPVIACGGTATGTASVLVAGGIPPLSFLWSNGQTTPTATQLTAGTYSLTVIDSRGCTRTLPSIVLTELPALGLSLEADNIVCSAENTGSIQTLVSGGTQPYNYAWSTGSSSSQLSGLAAGVYRLTVTDTNGCSRTDSSSISQTLPVVASASSLQVSCVGATDGLASVQVSSGAAPFSFSWSNGDSGQTIDSLPPGTYLVTVTDANECAAALSVVVQEPNPLLLSIESSPAGCSPDNGGQLSASPMGGTPPYTYNWSTGAQSTSITNLPLGFYQLTVTDFFGCTVVDTAEVVPSPLLSVELTIERNTCAASEDGRVAAVVTGGQAPYVYAWSNGVTGTAVIDSLTAGTYSVTVTDNQACVATDTLVLLQFPQPVCSITLVQHAFGGSNGAVAAAASGGTAPYTFLWSNGATTPQLSGLSPGTYGLTVTDANGCSSSCSIELLGPAQVEGRVWLDTDLNGLRHPSEPGVPDIMVIISTPPGQPAFLDTSITNAQGVYTFTVPPGQYKLTFMIPPALYNATAMNAGNDQLDSDVDPLTLMTPVFTVGLGEVADFDAGLTVQCENLIDAGQICCNQYLCGPGQQPDTLRNTVVPSGGSGDIEYIWMFTTASPSTNIQYWMPIPNSTSPNFRPGPLSQTTHFIRCARRAGCSLFLESNVVTITVGNESVANIEGPSQVCRDVEVSYQATGSQANAVYSWDFGPVAVPRFSSAASQPVRFVGSGVFPVRLSVTQNGCTATSVRNVSVIINPTICGQQLNINAEVTREESREVTIRWEMPAEVTDIAYLIQRSADGQRFETLHMAYHASDSTANMNYFTYVDHANKLGRSYYRIVARDAALNELASNVEEVILFGDSRLMMLYPNPTNDWVTIELFDTFDETVGLQLSAANGIVLFEQSLPATVSTRRLDLSAYPRGLYFVRVRYGQTYVKTFKILRN
jgi:hypothetical protein